MLKPRLEKSNNSEFWINKISRNRERDDEINKKLLFLGWTVIRFWGDEIKKNEVFITEIDRDFKGRILVSFYGKDIPRVEHYIFVGKEIEKAMQYPD